MKGVWNDAQQPAWIEAISSNIKSDSESFKLLFGRLAQQNPRNLQGQFQYRLCGGN